MPKDICSGIAGEVVIVNFFGDELKGVKINGK